LPNHVHAELGMHMKMPAIRYRSLDTVAHGVSRYAKIKVPEPP
jgi:hypothetical protein